jgi:hypothetical protein
VKLYLLTLGQIDAVAGAEGPADLNGHVLPIAITSPERHASLTWLAHST